ncbi:MAG: ergothioneine biosynthesis protein EgtC [Gammaproteobacteria bacterium]
MCRLAAYVGPSITLEQFLLNPPHGLLVQAWRPREMHHAALGVDGFGLGWYGPDELPATYVNPMPIWSDVNLSSLSRSLSCDLWLTAVRSATPGYVSSHANLQPFSDEADLLFIHDGYITDFRRNLRPALRQFLDPAIEADMEGNTDSEYLFALLRHLLAGDDDLSIEEAIAEMMRLLDDWLEEEIPALLNFVISDGERLYAVRHAVNADCPSLYYTTDDETFPGGQLVASERLTETEYWQPVPEHHILILDAEEPPELLAL